MKVFNLKRGAGKTIRMIYASELHNAPIICMNSVAKDEIIKKAKMLDIKIPEPLSVQEFITTKRGTGITDVLIDESMLSLQNLLSCTMGRQINVIAATLTSDE